MSKTNVFDFDNPLKPDAPRTPTLTLTANAAIFYVDADTGELLDSRALRHHLSFGLRFGGAAPVHFVRARLSGAAALPAGAGARGHASCDLRARRVTGASARGRLHRGELFTAANRVVYAGLMEALTGREPDAPAPLPPQGPHQVRPRPGARGHRRQQRARLQVAQAQRRAHRKLLRTRRWRRRAGQGAGDHAEPHRRTQDARSGVDSKTTTDATPTTSCAPHGDFCMT